jgi:hypothetical protein
MSNQLTSADHQGLQFKRLGIRQRARLRFERLREPVKDTGVDLVRLRQDPSPLGEITHLARVDDGHRNARRPQRPGHEELVTAGRFHHDKSRLLPVLRQSRDQAVDPAPVVRLLPQLACVLAHAPSDIERRLGHIEYLR